MHCQCGVCFERLQQLMRGPMRSVAAMSCSRGIFANTPVHKGWHIPSATLNGLRQRDGVLAVQTEQKEEQQ
jgi:hypothetical protein